MRTIQEIDTLRGAISTLYAHANIVKDATGRPLDQDHWHTLGGMLMALDWMCGEEVENVDHIYSALVGAGLIPKN